MNDFLLVFAAAPLLAAAGCVVSWRIWFRQLDAHTAAGFWAGLVTERAAGAYNAAMGLAWLPLAAASAGFVIDWFAHEPDDFARHASIAVEGIAVFGLFLCLFVFLFMRPRS